MGTRFRGKVKDEDLLREMTEEKEREKLLVSFIDKIIGYGVFAKRDLAKDELIAEYRGSLLPGDTEFPDATTYVYFFMNKDKEYCIDATNNQSIGRYFNDLDRKTKANCKIRKVIVDGVPKLGIFTLKDINIGSELRYDYGCADAPWRKHQKRIEKPVYKEPVIIAKKKLFIVASGFHDSLMSKTAKYYTKELPEIEFQNEINEQTTHIVMHTEPKTSHIVNRTLKYFIGISKGLWVVNENWLEDSFKSNKILPEDDYEISGDSYSDKHDGPKMARNCSSQLFEGYSFVLKNFKSQGDMTKDDVENLIENLHGTVKDNLEEMRGGKNVVLYNGEAIVGQIIKEPAGVHWISINWFLDCISSYTVLDIENYLLHSGVRLAGNSEKDDVDYDEGDEDDDFEDDCDEGEDMDYVPESESDSDDEMKENSYAEVKENNDDEMKENSYADVKENSDDEMKENSDDEMKENSDDEVKENELEQNGSQMGPEENNIPESDHENETSEIYPAIAPKVIIQERSTNGVNQQKYFSCLYCDKLVTKLPRHLQRFHMYEDKVKEALQLPLRSDKRRKAWLAIQQEGNYNHNFQVLSKGCGLIIPKYRSRDKAKKVEDYVPCEFCFGLYVKRDLWKHHKKCKTNLKESSKKGKPIANGKLLLPSKADTEVNEKIFVKMRDDEIKAIINNDKTILELANRMFEKNGHLQHRHQYIAQRLRELGRLLIVVKDTYSTIDSIEKCLDPTHWEEIISAVKVVSGFNNKTGQYTTPSLPLRLGQSLVKCAQIHKTRSIISCNNDVRQKMENFVELYNSEWSSRISAKCHNTLHLAKFNKAQLLPLTKDVQTLHHFLKEESEKLRKDLTISDYRTFSEICLAQIILFNRKRSGEAERIRIEDFENSVTDTEIDSAIINHLTPLEKEIIKSHKRIEIIGKRGSKVPVILTDDMVKNLNVLLNKRKDVNINSNFLFGKENSQFPIRGSDALRNVALSSSVENPSLLTSTKLRKQLATLSQVLGLNEHGQDALAKFMGHDIRVHRQYYDLPENTMELARMAKVLHSANEGNNPKLEDVMVTEEDFIDEDSSDSEVEEKDTEFDEQDIEPDEFVGKFNKHSRKSNKHSIKSNKHSSSRSQGSKSWSKIEQEAVLRHLGHHVLTGKLPGKLQCEEVKMKEAALSQRTWQHIKFFIRNRITSKNRNNRPLLLPFK